VLQIEILPALRDNYCYLVHDPRSGSTAAVDPPEPEPVLRALDRQGWRLSHVLSTHHHSDHTGGNRALVEATGCEVVGYRPDAKRVPGLTIALDDGDTFALGEARAQVLAIPGHTTGHVAYWFEDDRAVFCGDTLFAMGCGRLFEGTPEQMWASLSRLSALPPETRVYCGHEYTQANARFAITIEPANQALQARLAEVDRLRADGRPTIPSTIALEHATNPFLRADEPAVRRAVGLGEAAAWEVFAAVRRRKDTF
jgi:hydroxyacylglutathione hydrolase